MAERQTNVTPDEMKALLGEPDGTLRAVTFDFRRQERMSKENEQSLRLVMGNVGRYLSSSLSTLLRSVVGVTMQSLKEASFETFTADLPATCLIAVCSAPPLEGKIIIVVDPGLCLVLIDRLMGGPGDPPGEIRELTEIETVLLRRVIERTLDCLREALASIVTARPVIDQLETSPHFVQLATGSDAAIVVTYDVTVRTAGGKIRLCMPYHMLKPLIPRLHEHLWFQDYDKTGGNPELEQTRQQVMDTPVELRALLGQASISVAELLDLREGDCVVLDRREDEDLPLLVAGQERLQGRLGVAGRHYAVAITGWSEEATGSEGDSHDNN